MWILVSALSDCLSLLHLVSVSCRNWRANLVLGAGTVNDSISYLLWHYDETLNERADINEAFRPLFVKAGLYTLWRECWEKFLLRTRQLIVPSSGGRMTWSKFARQNCG
jgi:hypothetical protein